MKRLRRTLPFLLAATAGLTPVAAAGDADSVSTDPVRAEWHISQSAQFRGGYADNLMLSAFAPLPGAFGEAEAEVMVLRTLRGGWELSAYAQGTRRHYRNPDPVVQDESGWFSHVETRWEPRPALRLALALAAFGESSILDLSETESNRLVAPVRLRGGFSGISARVGLSPRLALRLSARSTQTDYRNLAGDYDALEQRTRLEWNITPRLTAGFDWKEIRRDYAERPQYTAGGRPISGTRLSFWRAGGEASLTLHLDADSRRLLTVTVGESTNRDRASGYFDVNERHGGLRLDWRAGGWTLALETRLRRDSFLVQTGGTGIAPPPRRSQRVQSELQVERKLSDHWSALTALEHDQDRGNLAEFSYAANTASLGLKCAY